MTLVERLASVGVNSSDADRLAEFYCRAFDCTIEYRQRHSRTAFERLTGIRGGARSLQLRLAKATLEILEFDELGRPYRSDFGASDIDFQHFAIVVADMIDAFERLRQVSGWTALSTAGPQLLPASSGGVSAFKFRDPDGHPLELLSFAAGRVPTQWDNHDPNLMFLGIDHSAIVVAEAERALQYYQNIGLTVTTRTVNRGIEQQRLDGVENPIVDVIGLAPHVQTPHIELLHYHRNGAGAPIPLQANDMAASRLIFEAVASTNPAATLSEQRLIRDPDGHFLQIISNGWTMPNGIRSD